RRRSPTLGIRAQILTRSPRRRRSRFSPSLPLQSVVSGLCRPSFISRRLSGN
ncbi:hypothetical protein S245_049442, partial [Arachis hypogaea]